MNTKDNNNEIFIYGKYTSNSHYKVFVDCYSQQSTKCEKKYMREYRDIIKTMQRNDGEYVCLYCSRFIKFSGRKNPNCKYQLDDSFMEKIDTDFKAYFLGIIASDGNIGKNNTINISLHQKDVNTLLTIKEKICDNLNIKRYQNNMVTLTISSKKMCDDVLHHLKLPPKYGKKCYSITLPCLENDDLTWAFIRGFFDGDGSVCVRKKNRNYPRCNITSNSDSILKSIKDFSNIPCSLSKQKIEYNGKNALDFLGKLYINSPIRMDRKYNKFIEINNWKPVEFKYIPLPRFLPKFRYLKTCDDAISPEKSRLSDSGYDLFIVKKIKELNNVHYYDTCIKVQLDFGYYFDLVARSSITKTGWMLANNIGIIDQTYTGTIIVALMKMNENANILELPCKIVQLIPRKVINFDLEEVDVIEETERNDGCFGSTNK